MSPASNLRPALGDDVIEKILTSNKPTPEVARELGISRTTAWRIRKAAGVMSTHFTTTNRASIARREARRKAAQEGHANSTRRSPLDNRRAMVDIDNAYIRSHLEPRAGRCCGRCKTPYNCGNKGCPCHG